MLRNAAAFLSPCSSKIQLKEMFAHGYSALDTTDSTQMLNGENPGQSVFLHTANDNKLAPLMDDLRFLQIMSIDKTSLKVWSHPFLSSPLPFQGMKAQYLEFVKKMLTNKHAEIAVGISHHLEYITQRSQDRSVWCSTPVHLTKESLSTTYSSQALISTIPSWGAHEIPEGTFCHHRRHSAHVSLLHSA